MIVIYNEDGRITQTIDDPVTPEVIDGLERAGVRHVRVTPDQFDGLIDLFTGHHISEGCLTKRPVMEALVSKSDIKADGKHKAVIRGLPRPCVVRIDGQPIERKGGTITLTADVPATYRVEVDHWPYLPWSAEIVAT
ncbi:hypothetical protein [Aurantimonas endophytica]|uniref:Uncharacterized protein n=1 Tax=Aurantimonas endophytica TaxID=1522175 RepID=A0A7W6HAG0_9HYPH|nr:hypothetical protein [Aurantimonas endophytica]MBB4001604.1 hypothetical protein [Aurantimonas endophytica]MCO6402757.1 hypothetical protein [Aurantimonas endophytica]